MGFPYFDMEFSTRFPYSEVVFSTISKGGLERNCKIKNLLEFDVERDGGIVFERNFFLKRLSF